MSHKDRGRWDRRWAAAGDKPYEVHPLLLENAGYLAARGQALDLACGRGQNAIWLAQHGYRVLGVDISAVAIDYARDQAAIHTMASRAQFQVVDLERWSLPVKGYDLICVFRFLDRRLFGPIRSGLRPGGLVYYSTRHMGALAHYPEASESYLLQPGELGRVFSDWQILLNEEGAVDASLIARRPAGEESDAPV